MKKLVSILSICLVLGSVIINFNNSGSITIENPSLQIDLNKDATEISNLVITNDDDFVVLAISEGWDGNGTSELPFIIENYMFTGFLKIITKVPFHFLFNLLDGTSLHIKHVY